MAQTAFEICSNRTLTCPGHHFQCHQLTCRFWPKVPSLQPCLCRSNSCWLASVSFCTWRGWRCPVSLGVRLKFSWLCSHTHGSACQTASTDADRTLHLLVIVPSVAGCQRNRWYLVGVSWQKKILIYVSVRSYDPKVWHRGVGGVAEFTKRTSEVTGVRGTSVTCRSSKSWEIGQISRSHLHKIQGLLQGSLRLWSIYMSYKPVGALFKY